MKGNLKRFASVNHGDILFDKKGEVSMDDIEYLYHYTSIETLALILKNHTIRFNPSAKLTESSLIGLI